MFILKKWKAVCGIGLRISTKISITSSNSTSLEFLGPCWLLCPIVPTKARGSLTGNMSESLEAVSFRDQ